MQAFSLPKTCSRHGARLAAALALALTAALSAVAPVQAANSPEAIEAVRKHRAEQARDGVTPHRTEQTRGNAPRLPPDAINSSSHVVKPFRSSANPSVDPNISLKSCMDHVGMNPAARDRCMRQHCAGRWGKGDCPAGGNILGEPSGRSRTPLGRCLTAAGSNPMRRNACGWEHCKMDWSRPECQALVPRHTQQNN